MNGPWKTRPATPPPSLSVPQDCCDGGMTSDGLPMLCASLANAIVTDFFIPLR